MSLPLETGSASGHVRCAETKSVVAALKELGVVRGRPVAVWPPRSLPHGLFLSSVRNGWVSLWTPLDDLSEWFGELTGSLECPGVLFEVADELFWATELYRDGELLGRCDLPTEWVEAALLQSLAEEALEREGVPEPQQVSGRLEACMLDLAASSEYRDALEELRAGRFAADDLTPFLPSFATAECAWTLLTACDHPEEESEPGDETAETYVDRFASYLGIRDAAWNPSADADALAEGDYDDGDGLPDGWKEFRVLPLPKLPVL